MTQSSTYFRNLEAAKTLCRLNNRLSIAIPPSHDLIDLIMDFNDNDLFRVGKLLMFYR